MSLWLSGPNRSMGFLILRKVRGGACLAGQNPVAGLTVGRTDQAVLAIRMVTDTRENSEPEHWQNYFPSS
jgi:hypothetical protein